MLDLSDIGAAKPSDKLVWRDEGERWVSQPRQHAPGLDSFMAWAHGLGAEEIKFKTWSQAQFTLYDDNYRIPRLPLDEAEASLIVNHLYGADGMARLQGGHDFDVMYVIGLSRTETLRFRVNATSTVTSRGDGVDVSIRPVKDLPPPLEVQNVEPEILESYHPREGLVMVSGATGSGKSTLIGGMTVAKLLDPNKHRNILECAAPIEFLLDRVKSPHSSISQSEIPRNLKSFEAFMRGAMRRHPTDIIVGECRDGVTMKETINAAISGHSTITTTHAKNVAATMQRIAVLCPLEERESLTVAAAQSLHLIVNQRLVKSTDGKRTALREFLAFDEKLRARLTDAPVDQWPRVTREAVETQGQSYERAIEIALREERITKEAADDVRRELK
ncbi:Defect in organelle trafficking protein DotB [Methylocella tundrae]|uniref:Defect in organelle trafficking protein DotB n=1 Tax=Methylocella tundrae TaxID=227605 RepID=A0A8B6M339_METTU|nr:ATPase, T2SS/T4P/T4SS family [Methylocella tundrae]VTZ48783.1 Defect in organelle trafficking protein DotB [Methylocella tundrae]